MNREMEIVCPSSYVRNASWLFEESKRTKWTPEENKQFEKALALFDKDTPDRWQNVAAMIPGKTVNDVIKQYTELVEDVSHIEAGLIPIPGYSSSSFTLEWANHQSCDELQHFYIPGGKRGSSTRNSNQERKKGVPWTEEEHRQFLLGLKKYGKGDWRNIARNFVTTRTPTQVASHAQKYFIRQLSGAKDKRRSSIHDITTVNLPDTKSPSSSDTKLTPSPNNERPSPDMNGVGKALHNYWNQPNQGGVMAHNYWNQPNSSTLLMGNPCGTPSYGLKLQEQNLRSLGCQFGTCNTIFQMNSAKYQ